MSYYAIESFLRSRVGQDWDIVHSELCGRLPSGFYNREEIIARMVADCVEHRADGLWDRRAQSYIPHPKYDAAGWTSR